MQLALGAEIDNVDRADFVSRFQDLEYHNRALLTDLSEARTRAERLTEQHREAEETVASLRLALRKAIRAVP